ncbi:MAG: acyl carrier protein [Arcobacter sp.]|nr:MAG: acyl carrier protein [Arcobacter sp.]
MENKEKYDKVFVESFGINYNDLTEELQYNSIPAWDSVGHMSMIAELEDKFEIMLEMDEIIDFSSYTKGKEILEIHGLKIG